MYAVSLEMEELKDQSDQPPPTSVTIQGDAAVKYGWLEEHAIAALVFLGKEHSSVAIRVVDDATMSELHVKHSGVAGTTDVLTFASDSSEDSIEADIAICCDVAQRVAQERGHSIEEELLLYIVHGMLHCIGFDDHDEEAHQKIHDEEDRVLSAIGVGSVWSNDS